MAKPVVASAVGDIPTIVHEGETGFLVRPGDPVAMADRIFALAQEPRRLEEVGQAARGYVLAHHTWDHNARRLLELAAQLRRMA